ncbi:ATP synthase F1 subunit gamma [Candidatus Gracilibacteria bacterium HOT-871]|nr:ATP synthase F1 subunit gamma [Candidatus Gracilibacteria bacterium HOT-871]MBB1564623.1 ATP synthase F1 subunit gamma [Candidatus Gracilibacteria bacterium]MBF0913727.1 ATP synthase F1 subunit gamma [Candidatus Gracilibacteria bacterium]RKW23181.1 MAG: ATP synthase F1 subunit gamma [Candidatus Gracilibacteria bacterium]
MANAKEIKRKIGSIKNTGKITKAMELISTVKMKKAQDLALEKRGFVLEMLKIFLRVEDYLAKYPLFSKNESKKGKTLGIVITSNKGLCGGYNVNVMKRVSAYVKETGENIDYISIGRKAAQFIAKTGNNLIADFTEKFTDNIGPIFTKKISNLIVEEYLSGKYNKVVIFYNYYVNTIKQIAVSEIFLPIESEEIKQYLYDILGYDDSLQKELESMGGHAEYDVEPNPKELMKGVIPMILDMMFYDTLLNAKASEHSSRMVAMKSAKDNSNRIAKTLTTKYNKARQAAITTEVSEITAGVESMKG